MTVQKITVALALFATGVVPACAQERGPLAQLRSQPIMSERTELGVCVFYYNYASVPPAVLTNALRVASRIFKAAGVDTNWFDAWSNSKAESECRHSNIPIIYVRILSRTMADRLDSHVEAIGSAVTTDDNSSTLANVFYYRLENLRCSRACSRALILGNVMAHELGHLLAGDRHSKSGIMTAIWKEREITQLRAGHLVFSPEEAERIQQNILGRQHGMALSARMNTSL